MIDPYFVIRSLALLPSRKDKENVLRAKSDLTLFWGVVQYTYHPRYNYFVKNIVRPQEAAFHPEGYLTQGELSSYGLMFTLLDSLRARVLTGDAARLEIENFMKAQPANVANVFWLILQRDLECGVTETTANKIMPDLVPTFAVQLAKEADISEEGELKDTQNWPLFAEEKYDGVRIVVFVRNNTNPEFFTRNGLEAYFPNLAEEVKLLPPGFVYDGELTGQDRKSVSGLVNKFLKGTAKGDEDKKFVFNVFDMLSIEDFEARKCDERFTTRRNRLAGLMSVLEPALRKGSPCVRLVDSYALGDMLQVQAMFDAVVEIGGEGLILKSPYSLYNFKRDTNWLKMKETKECELIVKGWTPGNEGKRHGKIGSIECWDRNGMLKVDVGSGFNDKTLEEVTQLAFEGKLIGHIVTVKFNAVIDKKDGGLKSLFLPRFKDIRLDKTEANSLEEIEKIKDVKSGNK